MQKAADNSINYLMKNALFLLMTIVGLMVASVVTSNAQPPDPPHCNPFAYVWSFTAPSSAAAGSNFNITLTDIVNVAVPNGTWTLAISQTGGDITCFVNGVQQSWGSGTIYYDFSTPSVAANAQGVYNIQLRFGKRYSGSNTVTLTVFDSDNWHCAEPDTRQVTITK
jgi:hypothetical protein